MKLGELKIASLMLVAPSLEINYDSEDSESICEKIMELKSNPNIIDYMAHLPLSINRAFSVVEGSGATKTKHIQIPEEALEKTLRGYRLNLDNEAGDVLYVERVYQGGFCEFEREVENKILLKKKSSLEAFYKSKLARINESTSDLFELELEDGVAEILPYFIKSELIMSESPEEARKAKEYFFELLKPFSQSKIENNCIGVETVFSME